MFMIRQPIGVLTFDERTASIWSNKKRLLYFNTLNYGTLAAATPN